MPHIQNITVSGGILTQQFVELLRRLNANNPKFQPEAFALSEQSKMTPAKLESDIAGAWELALEHWDSVHGKLDELDLPAARRRLILPLLQLLEFEPQYLRGDTRLKVSGGDELRFALSHRGWGGDNAPIIHTVHPNQKLDDRSDNVRGSKSPHDLVQSFLIHSSNETWGIVTNGTTLRLVRDFHHTYTKGYVEFDLQNIFEERSYYDFLALYRLCHASRFIPDDQNKTPLDYFYEHCISTGVAVGRDLRANVIHAIESLANGFLEGEFIGKLQRDEDECRKFYSEVLHVVYRVIFLLYAEQRGMMPGRNSLYAQEYSITSLRERAEKGAALRDDHTDLWEGLKVTFRMVEKGVPGLGIFAYNGALFSSDKTPTINNLTCRNGELLRAILNLTFVRKDGVLQRISYADLGVEEIGSIYESLLDFTPRVTTTVEEIEKRQVPANRFVLDPRGSARKTSASYYTHPQLVNLVIESALKPVYEDRVRHALDLPEDKPVSVLSLSDEQKVSAEKAVLSMKVCDPACGSGAFLIGADTFLGQELAKIRAGDEYPTEAEVRKARRDILSHCIYGVDLNPMAVELCKVSLWINACVENYPLNFLDHHIKCGNSLIGVVDPSVLQGGVPDKAFDEVSGDAKSTAGRLRKRNKTEHEGLKSLFSETPIVEALPPQLAERFRALVEMDDDTPEHIKQKAKAYEDYRHQDDWWHNWHACNLWTSAFFWPLMEWDEDIDSFIAPTQDRLSEYLKHEIADARLLGTANVIALENRFFHWYIEFPEVFEQGGFDVVLGNPPWERIKLEEEEHWADDPYISKAVNKAQRAKRIAEYRASNDPLKQERIRKFDQALHNAEAQSKFLRHSSRYPLTAQGDINTYAVFSELMRSILHPMGRAGIIVPTGIATDNTTKDFFGNLIMTHSLARLIGFENEAFIFADVHHSFKFCALVMTGARLNVEQAGFIFLCRYFEQVNDIDRHFRLSSDEFHLLNPNTHTCPIFRTEEDAELTKKIYRHAPVLMDENKHENPWGIRFQTMFHMSGDSDLFQFASGSGLLPLYEAKMMHQFDHRFATYENATQANLNAGILPQTSAEQKRNPNFSVMPRYWVSEEEVILRTSRVPPGLISAYRSKDEKKISVELATWFAGYHSNRDNESPAVYVFNKLCGSAFSAFMNSLHAQAIERDYPLTESDIQNVINHPKHSFVDLAWMLIKSKAPKWLLGFRDVTSSVVERTAIFSLLSRVGVGHTAPLMFFSGVPTTKIPAFLANVNSLIFDYIARQKVSGHLTYTVLNQLAALPPESYDQAALHFIVPRVLELVYTSWDIKPFADDVWRDSSEELQEAIFARWHENRTAADLSSGIDNTQDTDTGIPIAPFIWNDDRRAIIRAELDAYYAKLYGLNEEELRYILDPKDIYGPGFPSETFRVLKEKEIDRYGEYRTQRLVLEAWKKLEVESFEPV